MNSLTAHIQFTPSHDLYMFSQIGIDVTSWAGGRGLNFGVKHGNSKAGIVTSMPPRDSIYLIMYLHRNPTLYHRYPTLNNI